MGFDPGDWMKRICVGHFLLADMVKYVVLTLNGNMSWLEMSWSQTLHWRSWWWYSPCCPVLSSPADAPNVYIRPASFSLPTRSSTVSTFIPACLCGGSSTLNTSSRDVRSTPKSAGFTLAIFFFLAFWNKGNTQTGVMYHTLNAKTKVVFSVFRVPPLAAYHDIRQGGVSGSVESKVCRHHCWCVDLNGFQATINFSHYFNLVSFQWHLWCKSALKI